MPQIKTTKQLRTFLCEKILQIADGTLETEKARNIVKMATQVNESLYAEVKVARTQLELGRAAEQFGELQL